MSTIWPFSKRHMSDDFWSTKGYYASQSSLFPDDRIEFDPEDGARFVHIPQADLFESHSTPTDGSEGTSSPGNSRKRVHDDFEQDSIDQNVPDQFSVPRVDEFDDMEMICPFTASQAVTKYFETVLTVSNPFKDVAELRHRSLREPIPVKGVNSYVKFDKLKTKGTPGVRHEDRPLISVINQSPIFESRNQLEPRWLTEARAGVRSMRRQPQYPVSHQFTSSIRKVPAHFGRSFGFDSTDSKLFKFFQMAICSGRTLLPSTNGWLKDLAPMAETDEMMHHAILAFAAGYVLDLMPSEDLLKRANLHYKRANELLTKKLESNSYLVPGQEDSVVCCIRVFWCDDIVQWESRRSQGQTQRWWQAVQECIKIMAKTDRSFRYYKTPTNVQCSTARTSNANNMAMVHLVAGLTLPLHAHKTGGEYLHPWLLEGTEKETRRIHGGTGLCPKLLHMFGQITHLCARMRGNSTSSILPLGAKALLKNLINFRQWSELSEGPSSPEELLQSCILKNGLVDTAREVTELSGEAWVQTARIYLQIRFFRLPRDHPHVQEPFKLLCRIIERLPCSGSLFTAQTPFFPVFLLGLIASRPEDRQIARNWFGTVVANVGARSNVPPIWQVLRETWNWMDEELIDDDMNDVDHKPICDRFPWWESLTSRWWERHGLLSIV